MKKFLPLLLFVVLVGTPVMADESDIADDLWTNYGIDISAGKEHAAVSDEDFEKAIEQLDSKVNKWKNWAEKRKKPKGEEFSRSNETELINNEHGEDTAAPVISLPVEIVAGDTTLPVGHYQVEGEKTDRKTVLNIYQAGNLMLKLPAVETNDDFEQEEILFAGWLPLEDGRIKIIYGSLDFNAYALVETRENENY